MSIPVRVDPLVRAHVAARGRAVSSHSALSYHDCPVCDGPIGSGPVALVYVGRYPDNPTSWTAVAVALHDACTSDPLVLAAPTADVGLAEVARLQRSADAWQEQARLYAVNAEDWRRKTSAAFAERDQARAEVDRLLQAMLAAGQAGEGQ